MNSEELAKYIKLIEDANAWLGGQPECIRACDSGMAAAWLNKPESPKPLEADLKAIEAIRDRMGRVVDEMCGSLEPTKLPEVASTKVLHMKLAPVPVDFLASHRYQVIRDKWRPLPTRRLPVARIDYIEDVSDIIKTLSKSFASGLEIMRKLREIIEVPTDELPRCACSHFLQ